jgi:hypothetical protein
VSQNAQIGLLLEVKTPPIFHAFWGNDELSSRLGGTAKNMTEA